ncbi:MAG: ArsR/SmtB family transcription factor [Solirubrobacteraceae bacterium]
MNTTSTTTPPLSDELLELIAQRMRIIGEPTRLRILQLLEQHSATVQEVADELMLPHQNASHHMNALHRVGVLSRTRKGSTAIYTLADYTAPRLIEQARASITGYIEELAHHIEAQ